MYNIVPCNKQDCLLCVLVYNIVVVVVVVMCGCGVYILGRTNSENEKQETERGYEQNKGS